MIEAMRMRSCPNSDICFQTEKISDDLPREANAARRDGVRLRLTASMSVRSRDARDGHRLQKVGFAGIEREPNGSVIERPPLGQSVGD
jgi:ribosomal protein S12